MDWNEKGGGVMMKNVILKTISTYRNSYVDVFRLH